MKLFSPSEMKLYKHATDHKWTVNELVKTIQLIKSADFKVEDVNVDIHRRIAAAIAQGKSKICMGYTLYMSSISQVIFLYMHDIYHEYTMYIKEF